MQILHQCIFAEIRQKSCQVRGVFVHSSQLSYANRNRENLFCSNLAGNRSKINVLIPSETERRAYDSFLLQWLVVVRSIDLRRFFRMRKQQRKPGMLVKKDLIEKFSSAFFKYKRLIFYFIGAWRSSVKGGLVQSGVAWLSLWCGVALFSVCDVAQSGRRGLGWCSSVCGVV